jgi:hypothetical protein
MQQAKWIECFSQDALKQDAFGFLRNECNISGIGQVRKGVCASSAIVTSLYQDTKIWLLSD